MTATAVQVQEHDVTPGAFAPALLRRQAAQALAEHRLRHPRGAEDSSKDIEAPAVHREEASPSRSKRIASLVTERYAQSQSYRAFLAAESEEAIRKANAVAAVAARSAQAVVAAQRALLEELSDAEAKSLEEDAIREMDLCEERHVAMTHRSRVGLTVRLFEEDERLSRNAAPAVQDRRGESDDSSEALALDEEITFRGSPTFDLERSSVAIPGNLLEFPRQLVAARKARPRYAEGPLREACEDGRGDTQLRIFEVEADQITSAAPVESSSPEWSSIWLDALADVAADETIETVPVTAALETAPLERRAMAFLVDACLIGAGFVVFATALAYNMPVLPSPAIAGMSSAGALAGILLIYQMLFLVLSEATPGMRYARIGLCTFSDENPTRTARLGRIFGVLLSACPLGLGFLWACLDDDGLGWHDRISGMYPRSY